MAVRILITILLFHQIVNAQTHIEFGYSFGANATTSRTLKSEDMTSGYKPTLYPSTWNNNFYMGWGSDKNKLYASYEGGGLGPSWSIKAYPNKYPYSNESSSDGSTNLSIKTGIKGRARQNSNLLKFSLLYKHTWHQKSNWQHKSIFGAGFLKTNEENFSAIIGIGQEIDSLGWVSHNFVLDKYENFRFSNLYVSLGYELTYKLGSHWNINAQFMYNQGLYKMVRWHTYRSYNESLTGYSEFDQQWSYSRLSYFTLLIGVSYNIGKKTNESL